MLLSLQRHVHINHSDRWLRRQKQRHILRLLKVSLLQKQYRRRNGETGNRSLAYSTYCRSLLVASALSSESTFYIGNDLSRLGAILVESSDSGSSQGLRSAAKFLALIFIGHRISDWRHPKLVVADNA